MHYCGNKSYCKTNTAFANEFTYIYIYIVIFYGKYVFFYKIPVHKMEGTFIALQYIYLVQHKFKSFNSSYFCMPQKCVIFEY